MKAASKAKTMTATAAAAAVASSTGLKAKDVKAVVASYMEVVAGQVKKNGAFKVGGALNLKLRLGVDVCLICSTFIQNCRDHNTSDLCKCLISKRNNIGSYPIFQKTLCTFQ